MYICICFHVFVYEFVYVYEYLYTYLYIVYFTNMVDICEQVTTGAGHALESKAEANNWNVFTLYLHLYLYLYLHLHLCLSHEILIGMCVTFFLVCNSTFCKTFNIVLNPRTLHLETAFKAIPSRFGFGGSDKLIFWPKQLLKQFHPGLIFGGSDKAVRLVQWPCPLYPGKLLLSAFYTFWQYNSIQCCIKFVCS